MRTYKPNEIVVGIRFFDKNKRVLDHTLNTMPATIGNVATVDVLLGSITLVHPNADNQIVVASIFGSDQIFTLEKDNPQHMFKPYTGSCLHSFTDAREFFKRFREQEQDFIVAGKKAEYAKLWSDYYRKLEQRSRLLQNGKSLLMRIVNNDLETPL